jgi:hypothetical protein
MKTPFDRDSRAPDPTSLILAELRFPRLHHMRRRVDESLPAADPANEGKRPPFLSVRAVALLAIIVIIAVLAAHA